MLHDIIPTAFPDLFFTGTENVWNILLTTVLKYGSDT